MTNDAPHPDFRSFRDVRDVNRAAAGRCDEQRGPGVHPHKQRLGRSNGSSGTYGTSLIARMWNTERPCLLVESAGAVFMCSAETTTHTSLTTHAIIYRVVFASLFNIHSDFSDDPFLVPYVPDDPRKSI